MVSIQCQVLLLTKALRKRSMVTSQRSSAIDPETGRYYAMAQIMTSDNQKDNKDGNYKTGVANNE